MAARLERCRHRIRLRLARRVVHTREALHERGDRRISDSSVGLLHRVRPPRPHKVDVVDADGRLVAEYQASGLHRALGRRGQHERHTLERLRVVLAEELALSRALFGKLAVGVHVGLRRVTVAHDDDAPDVGAAQRHA
eukprot:375859-Prymnesium_polylepis.1